MPLESKPHPQLVILLGGPGAGKGTQARLLSAAVGVPHVASGDLLREQQRRGTALGRATQAVMERGDLLPDDLVSDVVLARLSEPDAARGAVLDGFPRTAAQAHKLERWLTQHGGAVRAAVYLDVPPDLLDARLAGRRLDSSDAAERADDQAEVAAKRVELALREMPSVLVEYAARGLLHRVDGTQPVDTVHQEILRALKP